ncbi:hypothetical protein D1872_277780 [compost metagenome]
MVTVRSFDRIADGVQGKGHSLFLEFGYPAAYRIIRVQPAVVFRTGVGRVFLGQLGEVLAFFQPALQLLR